MINNPPKKQKNAVADPVRGLPDRREKKGNKKEPPRGTNYKDCNNEYKKTIPPESEVRNTQSSGKKAKQSRNKTEKASETIIDTNDRER